MGYIRQNCGIYGTKIREYTMGYGHQKLWDIFEKIRGILGKIMGYIIGLNWKYF